METLLPKSFIEALAGFFCVISIFFGVASLCLKIRPQSTRLFAIFIVVGLALFSSHWTTYFAGVFIVATAVTELEFLQNLAAIISRDKNYFDYKKATQGQVSPEKIGPISNTPSPMELKILNTLWTKQVNKFPDYSKLFTFRIASQSPEYPEFRESGGKLIGKKLVNETDDGQYFLTPEGFNYCKANYQTFPSEQWWPEEMINIENLKKVLKPI
jgi:hypothetical protein